MTDERPAPRERDDDALTHEPSEADALPIVARMVVEIRSDGTRTIARGAIEDRLQNHQVGVEARADSPLELARALTKLLVSAPLSGMLRGGLAGADRGDRELTETQSSGVRGYLGGLREALGQRAESAVERALERRLGSRKRATDEDSNAD